MGLKVNIMVSDSLRNPEAIRSNKIQKLLAALKKPVIVGQKKKWQEELRSDKSLVVPLVVHMAYVWYL
jgi:hypothetical protein